MALTLQAEQRLERVELTKYFNKTRSRWLALAQRVYGFVSTNYPSGADVRQDDVAQNLLPFILVDIELTNELDERRLTQKYWKTDFCDLVVDRCWVAISQKKGSR
jgi:hypothetical protein